MSSSIFNFRSPLIKKAYLVLLVIFFFFLFDRLLFLALRETMYQFYRQNPFEKDVFGRLKFLNKDTYDTLIMGSSRAEYGIHPIYLYKKLGIKAVSFAGKARYPRFFYEFYRYYRRRYGKPHLIIYGTDYFMFGRKTDDAQLAGIIGDDRRIRRLDPSGLNNPRFPVLSRISLLFRVKEHLDVFFTDVTDYLSFHLSDLRGRREAGVPPGISTFRGWPGRIDIHKPSRLKNSGRMPFAPFPGEEGAYFLRLLDLCRRDRVKVILVSLPDYIQAYNTNFEHERYRRELEKIAGRYINVQFWDFDSPGKFAQENPEDFLDGKDGEWNSHLSIHGAYIFNQMLCRRLRNYFRGLRQNRLD